MSDNTDGAIVALLPSTNDPIVAASSEPAHITMAWFGPAVDLSEEQIAAIRAQVVSYAAKADGPIEASVSGREELGDDKADVVMVDGEGLRAYRDGLVAEGAVADAVAAVEQHPEWLPHVTLGYPETPANGDYAGETVTFDRIAIWIGEDTEEFALGSQAEAPVDAPPVVVEDEEAAGRVHWHGVLAPVGVLSGDYRIFDPNAIEYRNFPLPFKGMRKDLPGHDESLVVGNITNAWEKDGLIYGEGTFATNEDAEYFIALREDEAMRGVSVDLDQAESVTEDMEGNVIDWMDPNLEIDPFGKYVERVTSGRLASATICAIPAFQEAYFALGTWEEAMAGEPIAAAGGWCAPSETIEVALARLQDEGETMRPAYTLLDELAPLTAAASPRPPMSWFEDPHLEKLTPLTVTEDGQVFGHAAGWGVCHIGFDKCVMAPKSAAQYAYFHTGALETDGGPIAVGQITMATGHANLSLGARPAVEHYDNTGTVVADIRCGEDKYGIWMAGQMRPGLTDKQIREFRAAAISGDWRGIGGRTEFVAALAVNVGGFPIPRTGFAASGSTMTSLVAAAIVLEEPEHDQEDSMKILARAVLDEFKADAKRIARAEELRMELNKDNIDRREKVLVALGSDE